MKKNIVILCLSCVLFSCRTDLNYDFSTDYTFELTPHWQDPPTSQDGLVVYIYSIEPQRPVIVQYLPYWGGKIQMPKGRYKAIVHSDYNFNLSTSDKNNYESIYAQLSPPNSDILFSNLPQNTISAVEKPFYLSDVVSFTHKSFNKKVDVYLKKQTKNIELNIKIIGSDQLESAQATLSGVSSKFFFASKSYDKILNDYLFIEFDIQTDYLKVILPVLGLPNQNLSTNIINFIFKTKDGVIHHNLKTEKDITTKISDDIRKNGGVVWINDLNIIIPKLKSSDVNIDFPVNDFVENTEDEIIF